jgi:hypothetical protein
LKALCYLGQRAFFVIMKKRIIFFCIIYSTLISTVFAQRHFSKMYNLFGGWEAAYSVVSVTDTEIIFCGDFTDRFNPVNNDSPIVNAITLFKIDANGTLIKSNYYYEYGYIYYTGWNSFDMNGNKNIFYGRNILGRKEKRYYFSTINLADCDTISTTLLQNTDTLADIRKFVINYNRIYGLGFRGTSLGSPFYIACFDTTGKQLWYKTYSGRRYFTSGVAIDHEGNFLLGGGGYKGHGGAFDTLFGWYAKMDTAGNFIWEKFHQLDDELLSGTPHIINGSYYWLGGRSQLGKITYSYLYKTDNVGNVTYQKRVAEGLVNSYHYMSCDLSNAVYQSGHFYGMGRLTDTNSIEGYRDFIQFGKYDTLGNLKWLRKFSQWYKDNRAFSLTAVPDGFIICADGKDTTHTTGFTDAWIIKTDTNGCILPGCHLTDGLVQITNPDAFINVFPNPASDNVTVQITDERAKLKSYFIYDTQGNFMLQQAIHHTPETFSINTQQLPNGNYYLVLELAGGERAVKKLMIQR